MNKIKAAEAYRKGTESTPYSGFQEAEIGEASGPTAEVVCRDGYSLVMTPIEGRTAIEMSIDPVGECLTHNAHQVVALAATMLGMLDPDTAGRPAGEHLAAALVNLRKATELLVVP